MQPDSVPKQMCIRDRLISVPSQYALAIETALGGALQNLIVADEEIAKSCIRRLQREKAGRATFLPLTSVKGSLLDQPGLDKEPGFIGLASELIDTCLLYTSRNGTYRLRNGQLLPLQLNLKEQIIPDILQPVRYLAIRLTSNGYTD